MAGSPEVLISRNISQQAASVWKEKMGFSLGKVSWRQVFNIQKKKKLACHKYFAITRTKKKLVNCFILLVILTNRVI